MYSELIFIRSLTEWMLCLVHRWVRGPGLCLISQVYQKPWQSTSIVPERYRLFPWHSRTVFKTTPRTPFSSAPLLWKCVSRQSHVLSNFLSLRPRWWKGNIVTPFAMKIQSTDINERMQPLQSIFDVSRSESKMWFTCWEIQQKWTV